MLALIVSHLNGPTKKLIIEWLNAKKLLESKKYKLRTFQVHWVILDELKSLRNELAKLRGDKIKEGNDVAFKNSRKSLLC